MVLPPKASAVANGLLVLLVIAWNYWTAIFGLAGNTVRDMSDAYDTLFTPASWAFSIWGLIFLLQLVHAGYQLHLAFSGGDTRLFRELGPWLMFTNALNIAWTFVWLNEWTFTSVLVLALMNVCMFVGMMRLRMALWRAPLRVIAFEWWPLALYAGWVAVAVLANLSAWLAKEGWVAGSSVLWAIGMIVLATAYNLVLVGFRNLREHALVGIWAFAAIAARQWNGSTSVANTAVAAAIVLFVAISIHTVRNRKAVVDRRAV